MDLKKIIVQAKENTGRGFDLDVDYDAAVQLMDDELRESLHALMAPCTELEFFRAYCEAHWAKYNEEFVVN